jgi:hypothetical protein
MIRFDRKLSDLELLNEKRKDYRNVVIIQTVIITVGLLLSDIILKEQESITSKLIITLFSTFSGVYAFLLWDLMRNFTNNQLLIKGVLGVIVLVVIVGLLTEFPFYNILKFDNRRLYLFILHGFIFPIEVLVIALGLYHLINFVSPAAFGVVLPLGIPSYSESIYYSFNILGGTETVYPDPIRIIRNIGVIEAVWGNLFVVLIIGKLLTMPKTESQ